MNCKDTDKSIPRFFDGELEGRELTEFLKHIKNCNDCKEELSIYFLASEGIARLEEGSSFDLDKELESRLDEQEYHIKMRHSLKVAFYCMEFVLIVIILIILWYVL